MPGYGCWLSADFEFSHPRSQLRHENRIGGSGVEIAVYSLTLSGAAISAGALVVNSEHFSGTSQALHDTTSTRVQTGLPTGWVYGLVYIGRYAALRRKLKVA